MKQEIIDLLDESLESLKDKKTFSKESNKIIKETAEACGVDKQYIKATKDLMYNKGKGWLNEQPLVLDTQAKKKDKISQTLLKLYDIIYSLKSVNMDNELAPYLDALSELGITIDYSNVEVSEINNEDKLADSIEQLVRYETNKEALNEQIEADGVKSEEMDFVRKKDYAKILDFYSKKKEEEDLDDKFQQIQADLLGLNEAYKDIYFTEE